MNQVIRRPQSNKEELPKVSLLAKGYVTFSLVSINVILILLLFVYMNQNSNQSNLINNDLETVNNLNMENQLLQMKIAKAQNITQVEQKATDMGLVPLSSILYVNSKGSSTSVTLNK